MTARILVLAFWILGCAGPADAQGEGVNETCFACHDYDDMTVAFEDGEVSAWVEAGSFTRSVHGGRACTTCHRQVDLSDHPSRELPRHSEYAREMAGECDRCHVAPGEEGVALIEGFLHPTELEDGFLCTDCHDAHTMTTALPGSVEISQRCVDCHEGASSTLAGSVHGTDLHETGYPDLPVCASCHDGHASPGKPDISLRVRLGHACRDCHGNTAMAARHDLSLDVVETYLADFHGVTLKLYENPETDIQRNVLVCADCHGSHDVRPASGANALAMKENLIDVCRGCHTDVAADFPDAWLSHYRPSLSQAPLVYLVKTAYWVFIPFVVVGLILQIIFHLVVFPIRRRKGAHDTTDQEPLPAEGENSAHISGYFTRFSLRQRLEHLMVVVTFVILLLTGLPQKFFDSTWAEPLILMLGGIDTVRLVHRVTGLAFAAITILHLLLAARGILLGKTSMSIVPIRKDFRDAVRNLGYYLGTCKDQPEFDRFDYRQKFEYWGMVIGSLIMIVTGFVLFFPTWFVELLPAQLIPAAKVAHSYEAMMALLTIIIWHMYSAILDPESFPLDTCIFTGKISRERLSRCHPLEYARLVGASTDSEPLPHKVGVPPA